MKKYLTILLWDIIGTLGDILWVLNKLIQIVALLLIWGLCELVIRLHLTTIHSSLIYLGNLIAKRKK